MLAREKRAQVRLLELQSEIPVVAIYNNLETFFKFLQRSSDQTILEARMYRGDRGIFWLGANKLLIVTKAVPHADYICDRWGYSGTNVFTPRQSTHELSLDIIRDADLSRRIVEYAGPARTVQLIPYASTPEFYKLVNHLRTRFGLNVILVESPIEANLWVRDYVDTKVGFRSLVSEWITDEDVIPSGFICKDLQEAAQAVAWFNKQQFGAVVKADSGESGIGHLIFPGQKTTPETVLSRLKADPFLSGGLIVVDKYIKSKTQLSPSLELIVPANGKASEITYLSRQLFSEFGHFSGVLISRELTNLAWYPQLAEYGLQIAQKLQNMGYVGHFDIDTVIDDDGHLYLLEINARRTGGTYVHEFARLNFGEDYLSKVSLLCSNAVKCGKINEFEQLIENLDGLLLPIKEQNRGIVITVTSSLSIGEFGCILVAPNEQELFELKQEMLARLETYSETKVRV